MAEIVVNKGELKGIRDSIDKLLKSGGEKVTIRTQFASYESEELSQRHKEILKYIKKNHGTIKEDVIRKNPEVGSRMTIVKSINDLIKMRMVIVRPDDSNHHIQPLYINNEDVLLALINDLEFFKQVYFMLIDQTSKKLEKYLIGILRKAAGPRYLERSSYELFIPMEVMIESLLMPYKNLIMMYVTSDLLLWHERPLDKKNLHNKFAIVYTTMKEIQTKLHESIPPLITTLKVLHKEPLNVELYSLQSGLGREHIRSFIHNFWRFKLGPFVEPVLDILWRICYPILTHDPSYNSVDPEKLKDWRNIISGNNFNYMPKTTQAGNLGRLLP